jgi:aspartyl-tRNA(Asn)/glutamyl-tRNA(Gln) amidotransferase subunit A
VDAAGAADGAPAPGIFITELDRDPAGIGLAVKDLFDTAGVRTTYGSAVFGDHVPDRTAEAVRRLEAAGYATVGKANLHEFAFGTTSENPHYGDVPNPIAPGRVAGGSSGGSAAALAAGHAAAALGTDSGGSIRIPAACCGIVGFKPTYGLVAIDGCYPLAPSFDHAGPMARTVPECASMMAALAPELEPAALDSLADLELGVAWTDRADPLVASRVEAAAALFPHRRSLELPRPRRVDAVFQREVADVHRETFARGRELYGRNVAVKVERCLAITDAVYDAGLRERERYRERMAAALAEVDLVLTPTLRCVAPPAGADEVTVRDTLTSLTFPFNAIGAPAIAIPCGAAEAGLPASAQLVGRPGADALVLAAGELLERALGHTADPRRSD